MRNRVLVVTVVVVVILDVFAVPRVVGKLIGAHENIGNRNNVVAVAVNLGAVDGVVMLRM